MTTLRDWLTQPSRITTFYRASIVVKEDGDGIAPIGHKIYVSTIKEKAINVVATLKLRESAQFELVEEKVKKALEEHISGLSFEEDTLFYSKVIAAILDADMGIRDATAVYLNGEAENITLNKAFGDFETAKLGTVELKEAERRV